MTYTLKEIIALGPMRPRPLEMRDGPLSECCGRRYRHRLLGYVTAATGRPYGLLLVAESGDYLRNHTVRHEDTEWFAATWERID